MKNLVLLIILALVIAGGWYYFSSLQKVRAGMPAETTTATDTSSTTLPPGGMETGTIDSMGTTTEDDFTVNGFNFGFSPTTLTVKKGDHVKITFMNTGGVHDFRIDEFNVATPRIDTSASSTVEFNATKAGTFQYYCSVGNHRAMGMWGTLTVIE